jgi:uncharacterized protein YhaN
MSTNVTKLQEMRALEAQLKSMQAEHERLQVEAAPILELVEKINLSCEKNQIDRREVALALCPDLAKLLTGASSAASEGMRKRRARSVKIYRNPHNGEIVETKGGNHKTLKAWKAEHGSATVESWLDQTHAAA